MTCPSGHAYSQDYDADGIGEFASICATFVGSSILSILESHLASQKIHALLNIFETLYERRYTAAVKTLLRKPDANLISALNDFLVLMWYSLISILVYSPRLNEYFHYRRGLHTPSRRYMREFCLIVHRLNWLIAKSDRAVPHHRLISTGKASVGAEIVSPVIVKQVLAIRRQFFSFYYTNHSHGEPYIRSIAKYLRDIDCYLGFLILGGFVRDVDEDHRIYL